MNISSFIYDWLKNIVIILILLSLFNMVMPNGNMKRYMEHITGLIIIFTIISPLLNIVNIDFSLEKEVFNNIYENTDSYEKDVLEDYNKEIEDLYYAKIEERVSEIIKGNSDYKLIDIEINIHKEGNEYGLIKEINIRVSEEEKLAGSSNKIKIEQIKSNKNDNKDFIEDALATELKDKISEELGINKEFIYIYIKN